MSRLAFAENK